MIPVCTAVILVATMSPDMLTEDAVICPEDFKTRDPLELLIALSVRVKPPILPPSNSTLDPVICPDDFKTNKFSELVIVFPVIAKPPT